jgi:hypothetical protein
LNAKKAVNIFIKKNFVMIVKEIVNIKRKFVKNVKKYVYIKTKKNFALIVNKIVNIKLKGIHIIK